MNHKGRLLARKYSKAFLNVYQDSITHEELEKLKKAQYFLATNKDFYIALRMPSICSKAKEQALNILADSFNLCAPLRKLMHVVLEHGQIENLNHILLAVYDEYERRKQIIHFMIKSSHQLSNDQQNALKLFMERLSPNYIHLQFCIDPSLIVGVRIESNSLLWERSIRKTLLHMRQTVKKRGAL